MHSEAQLGSAKAWCDYLREAVLGLVYPPACAICQDALDASGPREPLCEACQTQVRQIRRCIRCSAEVQPHWHDSGTGCPWCQHLKFRFDGIVSLGNYAAPLSQAVLRAKTSAGSATTWGLGKALGERVAEKYGRDYFDLIVPVPCHWFRRLRRGVNSPEILAQALTPCLDGKLHTKGVRANRPIKKQSTLGITARRENVRQAYGLAPGLDLFRQKVLVVDDLLTTGATASALTAVLRKAKAAEVHVAVVARTAPRFMTDD